MPYPPLLFAKVTDADNEDTADYLLTGNQRYFIQSLLNAVQDNPSLYFADYDDFTPDDIDTLVDSTIDAIIGPDMTYAFRSANLRLTADNYDTQSGLTWTSSPTLFNAGFYSVTGLSSLVRWHPQSLQPGTYTIRMMCNLSASAPIVQISKPTATIENYATFDLYNVTNVLQTFKTVTGVSIQHTDDIPLQIKITGRNASNTTGYNLGFNWIDFVRTGP